MEARDGGSRLGPIIGAIFFFSGVAALIYQTVWIREFSLLFGGTVSAMSVVVSTFMSGLAVGAALFGRIADRSRRPLLLYAALELGIAVGALLLGGSQELQRFLVVSLIDSPTVEGTLLVRTLIAASMLGLPCVLMGGTLPVMARYVVRELPSLASGVGTLYFVNTLGAATGALMTGTFLVELLGLRGSMLCAVGLNLGAAVIALALSRGASSTPAHAPEATPQAPASSERDRTLAALAAVAFFGSGFSSLVLEMAWTRLLLGFMQNGALMVSVNLAIILVGLAVGGVAISRAADRFEPPALLAGVVFLCIALLALLGLGNAELLAEMPRAKYVPTVEHFVAVLGLLLPASLAMGALFPVMVRVLVRERERLGTQLGGYYALNTLGTVLGGILTPFLLIPSIGTSATLLFAVAIQLTLGLSLVGLAVLRGARGPVPKVAAAVAVLAVLLFPLRWDIYHRAIRAAAEREMPGWTNERAYVEGADSTVILYEMDPELARNRAVTNRYRVQVNASTMVAFDTNETKLMAHLPLMAVPKPERALVICFGVGNTFRSALAHDIEVDVVDINPPIPGLARIHQEHPERTFDDPKGRIYINDGRNFLLLGSKRYDMITIDPAPPIWGLGIGNLHAKEFYELISSRLTDTGVVEMWMLSDNADDFLATLAAFRAVFPHVAVFRGAHYDAYHVLGSRSPIQFRGARIEEVFGNPRIQEDLHEIDASYFTPQLLKDLYVTDGAGVDAVIRGVQPLVDDRPVQEYRLLRRLRPNPGKFHFPSEVARPLEIF